jgi:acyl-coenzyme A thioesterase PaaI-like protein
MSIYKKIAEIGPKFISKAKIFKHGFNLSPMYRRSTGRIIEVSDDLLKIVVKVRLSYKNRNYVNSIFGGSLFSAVDPIPMVQLINLIGDDYVVWDKSAEIKFKRPAKEHVFADFNYSLEEIETIKKRVAQENEIEIIKTTLLTNKSKDTTFCEVQKTIYVADKQFYKNKRNRKK